MRSSEALRDVRHDTSRTGSGRAELVPCIGSSDVAGPDSLCDDAGWLRVPRYAIFVSALEECSRDNLDFVKERAVRAIAALLRSKPEGEAALLTALVNKLGDPSRKLASKVRASCRTLVSLAG